MVGFIRESSEISQKRVLLINLLSSTVYPLSVADPETWLPQLIYQNHIREGRRLSINKLRKWYTNKNQNSIIANQVIYLKHGNTYIYLANIQIVPKLWWFYLQFSWSQWCKHDIHSVQAIFPVLGSEPKNHVIMRGNS
jgi:hypothetical protein